MATSTLLRHVVTKDGSSTLYAPKYDEHYHSVHGAVKESLHVFIEMGLKAKMRESKSLNIFEMGLGTGLNALLTSVYHQSCSISYSAVEAYPIAHDLIAWLNYSDHLPHPHIEDTLNRIHTTPWEQHIALGSKMSFCKHHTKIEDFTPDRSFDLIYYDAFAPDAQPELWIEEIFSSLYKWCNEQAILVTYSSKGSVRRAMQAAGFWVEKLPGPPGKREMLRAVKTA